MTSKWCRYTCANTRTSRLKMLRHTALKSLGNGVSAHSPAPSRERSAQRLGEGATTQALGGCANVRTSGGKMVSLLIWPSIHVMSRSTYTGVVTLVAERYLGLCSSFQKYSYLRPAHSSAHTRPPALSRPAHALGTRGHLGARRGRAVVTQRAIDQVDPVEKVDNCAPPWPSPHVRPTCQEDPRPNAHAAPTRADGPCTASHSLRSSPGGSRTDSCSCLPAPSDALARLCSSYRPVPARRLL
jgi:hypothetical protein